MWWFRGERLGSSSFLPLASSDLANEALASWQRSSSEAILWLRSTPEQLKGEGG